MREIKNDKLDGEECEKVFTLTHNIWVDLQLSNRSHQSGRHASVGVGKRMRGQRVPEAHTHVEETRALVRADQRLWDVHLSGECCPGGVAAGTASHPPTPTVPDSCRCRA